jgi:hypothetical protein
LAEVGRFRRRDRPFDFARGTPSAGRYPPDGLTIEEAIVGLRFAPVEIGYGFDASERQVFRLVGDHDEIRGFDQRDLAAIADGTFVHSHPPYAEYPESDPRRRAGSFSARDLVFMYEYQLGELIAVTQERTYHLRQKTGGPFLDPGEIRNEYGFRLELTGARLLGQAASGIISLEEADAEGRLADEVMESLSTYHDYRWEEVLSDVD